MTSGPGAITLTPGIAARQLYPPLVARNPPFHKPRRSGTKWGAPRPICTPNTRSSPHLVNIAAVPCAYDMGRLVPRPNRPGPLRRSLSQSISDQPTAWSHTPPGARLEGLRAVLTQPRYARSGSVYRYCGCPITWWYGARDFVRKRRGSALLSLRMERKARPIASQGLEPWSDSPIVNSDSGPIVVR